MVLLVVLLVVLLETLAAGGIQTAGTAPATVFLEGAGDIDGQVSVSVLSTG